MFRWKTAAPPAPSEPEPARPCLPELLAAQVPLVAFACALMVAVWKATPMTGPVAAGSKATSEHH